ncbi:hypothetical protein [Aliarcobacter skirrowii]|uniref:hypothetical protein n=1 Tax=Aliarcobacter skirrowii TaxID=28200 RepID=UPI000832DE85|nr:hypothetical protein [Aliarcobacter skirrowii]
MDKLINFINKIKSAIIFQLHTTNKVRKKKKFTLFLEKIYTVLVGAGIILGAYHGVKMILVDYKSSNIDTFICKEKGLCDIEKDFLVLNRYSFMNDNTKDLYHVNFLNILSAKDKSDNDDYILSIDLKNKNIEIIFDTEVRKERYLKIINNKIKGH